MAPPPPRWSFSSFWNLQIWDINIHQQRFPLSTYRYSSQNKIISFLKYPSLPTFVLWEFPTIPKYISAQIPVLSDLLELAINFAWEVLIIISLQPLYRSTFLILARDLTLFVFPFQNDLLWSPSSSSKYCSSFLLLLPKISNLFRKNSLPTLEILYLLGIFHITNETTYISIPHLQFPLLKYLELK
jgi:hypothetical protein